MKQVQSKNSNINMIDKFDKNIGMTDKFYFITLNLIGRLKLTLTGSPF